VISHPGDVQNERKDITNTKRIIEAERRITIAVMRNEKIMQKKKYVQENPEPGERRGIVRDSETMKR